MPLEEYFGAEAEAKDLNEERIAQTPHITIEIFLTTTYWGITQPQDFAIKKTTQNLEPGTVKNQEGLKPLYLERTDPTINTFYI